MKKMLMLMLALCAFSGMAHCDITWTTPAAISTPLTNASDPQVVIDNGGNITAIWIENNVILASHLPTDGSWSVPVSISNTSNTSSSPKLDIDSAGNVTALWIENTLVKSANLPIISGTWTAAVTVSGAGATTPSLAVDDNDNAVAVWTRGGFIEGASRVSGSWNLVSVLSATNSNNPNVYINNAGKAAATWHTVSGGSDLIVTNILTLATNVWGTAKNVFTASAAFSHNYPKIAIDNAGNCVIAWFRYSFQGGVYQNVQLLTSTLANGGAAWAIPTVSPDPGIRNPADLVIKLAYGSTGDAVVVWTTSYDGETFVTQAARKLFGTTWPTGILLQVPSIYSFGLDVAVASGTALLTNMAWDQVSAIQIVSQESDLTDPVLQAWTQTTILSTGNGNAYPKCALSINGDVVSAAVVWMYYDGANTVINATRGNDTVIPPVTNVAVTQNVTDFGVYKDYYNTITWDASPAENIIQYNIYRNGVYFAATDVNTMQFVDNNATQGGTVTYGISALISSFRQSAITTFTLNP